MKNIKLIFILFAFFALSLVSCPQNKTFVQGDDCLMFSSSYKFSLKIYSESSEWDGEMLLSFNGKDFKTWEGNEINAQKISGKYRLFLKGSGNTTITNNNDSNRFVLAYKDELGDYKDIKVEGNISTLLNGANANNTQCSNGAFKGLFEFNSNLLTAPVFDLKVASDNCFDAMYKGCTSLKKCPKIMCNSLGKKAFSEAFADCSSLESVESGLNSTSIDEQSYLNMFARCAELDKLPSFPASVKLMPQSCVGMFSGCSKIFVSDSNEEDYSDYVNKYYIPSLDDSVDDSNFSCDGMFSDTGNSDFDLAEIFALDEEGECFGIDYYTKNVVVK